MHSDYVVYAFGVVQIVLTLLLVKSGWTNRANIPVWQFAIYQIIGFLFVAKQDVLICCESLLKPIYVFGQLLAYWLVILSLVKRLNSNTRIDKWFACFGLLFNKLVIFQILIMAIGFVYR